MKEKKEDIKKLFGERLRNHREKVLKIKSVTQLSFNSNLDHSKLSKIEKGLVDIRFETLIEIAFTYKIPFQKLFDFEISYWKDLEKQR